MRKLFTTAAVLLVLNLGLSAQEHKPDSTAKEQKFELDFDLIDSSEDAPEVVQPSVIPSSKPPRRIRYVDQHWDDEYLDTVNLKKRGRINDYTLLGVQYGAGLSMVYWNPSVSQQMEFIPVNFGVTYTRYGKMFGFMPYFGIQVGLFYTREAWRYKKNTETNYIPSLPGTYENAAKMTVVELPVLAHGHIDFWKMKIIINGGFYAGYRLDIERSGNMVKDEYLHSFTDYNNRFDWGLKGGVGLGFVFDPVEIHIQGAYKHSFSSLYKPDYNSDIYYRYAYPQNIIVSVGLHVQLTKRSGKTSHDIRKEAKAIVWGTDVTEITK